MLFLVFQIAGHRYCIDTGQIVEVLPLVTSRSIPGVPPDVRGVFNFHGTVVPLLDAGMLIYGARSDMHRETRIALVEYATQSKGQRVLGILLERATGLMRRDAEDFVEPPVESGATYAGRVATDEEGMVQRFELRDLVSEDVWAALDGMPAEAAS